MKASVKLPRVLCNTIRVEGLVEVHGQTVSECLRELTRLYPSLRDVILDARGQVPVKWMVYVNGELAATSAAYSRPLEEGALIGLVPLVVGG